MSLEDAVIAWEQAVATQNTILVELSHRCQAIEAKLERNSQVLEAGNVRLSTIADGRDYLNSRYSDSHGKLEALEGLCNKLHVKLDTLMNHTAEAAEYIAPRIDKIVDYHLLPKIAPAKPKRKARK